ncbi:2-oxoglutarate dehydrogenase-like, mitochondrial, partial [Halyomorpha halys]|uniref:2-oxoglutarate dehydrogenase-like, mitochondrial n=1 Tax=Halyomorpha halys TaxID=286706 RepID=UPI0034D20638
MSLPVLHRFRTISYNHMCKIQSFRLDPLTRNKHFSALASGINKPRTPNISNIFLERYFSTGRVTCGELHPFDPVYTNLIIENIYKEIQSWMCKRVDTTDSQKLPVLERATALNRLLMTHCFDVLLTRDCPFSRYELHSPDDEICLPAICAIIDKAKQYQGSHFIVGTLQYRKLDTLSKILDVTPESIFMNVMSCRNKLSGVHTSAPYLDDRKKPDITVTLAGNSSYSSTIFPLTVGVTKALQQLEGDHDHSHVWPIICYDSNDIKDKSIYSNIIQTSSDSNFFTGGSIHVVLNEVEEELSMKQEKENQCKFLKIFADFLKAPIVHVKAEDVDSVI